MAQESLQKATCETKPTNMEDTNWVKMKEKVAILIHICVSAKVMYHILDKMAQKKIWDKLKSRYMSMMLMNTLFTK